MMPQLMLPCPLPPCVSAAAQPDARHHAREGHAATTQALSTYWRGKGEILVLLFFIFLNLTSPSTHACTFIRMHHLPDVQTVDVLSAGDV